MTEETPLVRHPVQGCSDCSSGMFSEPPGYPGPRVMITVHDPTCPYAAQLLPDRQLRRLEIDGGNVVVDVFADNLPVAWEWMATA